ncbi:MAG: hypothetical protein F6K04_03345 [Leptolyngbya sp. SIO4C5]|nr:hypothetical protein [Leptolyngbya sp. SIO4C5]
MNQESISSILRSGLASGETPEPRSGILAYARDTYPVYVPDRACLNLNAPYQKFDLSPSRQRGAHSQVHQL